jgi:hypothetical protein
VPPDAEQAEEEEEESEEMQEKRRIWEDFQDEYFDSEREKPTWDTVPCLPAADGLTPCNQSSTGCHSSSSGTLS